MIDFIKVEQTVKALKNQVSIGEIDQQTFKDRLTDMIDYAADGYYWMYGHKTESWYRHDGQQWVPDDPGRLQNLTPSHNNPVSNASQSLAELWSSVSWGWFIAGLLIFGIMAWIVYNSIY